MRTGTEVVAAIRAEVNGLKRQGTTAVPIDALEEYLAALHEVAGCTQGGADAHAAADPELVKLTVSHELASTLEHMKTAAEAGGSALKAATLINGGAAVALLALLGNLSGAPDGSRFSLDVQALTAAMRFFTIGVLTAGVSEFLRFLAYFFGFKSWSRLAGAMTILMCTAILFSFCWFFVGGVVASHALPK